jgi:regulator of PEP synthase PpsR (kinase-PPPase family)
MQFATEKKIPFFKVSAKTGEGADILLNHIINSLIKQFPLNNIKQKKDIKIDKKKKKNINKNTSSKTSNKGEEKKNVSNTTLLKPTNKEVKQKFLLLDKYYNY